MLAPDIRVHDKVCLWQIASRDNALDLPLIIIVLLGKVSLLLLSVTPSLGGNSAGHESKLLKSRQVSSASMGGFKRSLLATVAAFSLAVISCSALPPQSQPPLDNEQPIVVDCANPITSIAERAEADEVTVIL